MRENNAIAVLKILICSGVFTTKLLFTTKLFLPFFFLFLCFVLIQHSVRKHGQVSYIKTVNFEMPIRK